MHTAPAQLTLRMSGYETLDAATTAAEMTAYATLGAGYELRLTHAHVDRTEHGLPELVAVFAARPMAPRRPAEHVVACNLDAIIQGVTARAGEGKGGS